MRTEDLIEHLSLEVRPVGRHAALKRLCAGAACGAVPALLLLLAWLGLRPDFVAASQTPQFWMKWMFTLSLGAAALVMARRLGRADGEVGKTWWGFAAPVAIVAMMAVVEMLRAPPSARLSLWLGHTASQCLVGIVALSGPVFVGLLWAFRRMTPTRLRDAGAAAGLLAGAVGASVYALTCPEQTASFMVTWYSGGILAAGAIGALVGPRLLRW